MLGTAPSPDISIVFDGGSLGNPGKGYGSFRLRDRLGHESFVKLDYGDNVTNNQAEYRTLLAALEQAGEHAKQNGWQPRQLNISVRTDSKLVVEQVCGRWKVKNLELQPLSRRARELCAQFGHCDLAWQPRQQTVKVLGH